VLEAAASKGVEGDRDAAGQAEHVLLAASENLRAEIGAAGADDFRATAEDRGVTRCAAGLDHLRAGKDRVAGGLAEQFLLAAGDERGERGAAGGADAGAAAEDCGGMGEAAR